MGASAAAASNRDASWIRDPSGRYERRFWDGTGWTAWVSDHDDLGVDLDSDPADLERPGAVVPDRPESRVVIASAVFGVATSLVALVAVRSLRDSAGWGSALGAQIVGTLLIEFAAMVAVALAIAAVFGGARACIQNHRRQLPNRSNVFVVGAGAAALAIAISALTKI